MAAYFGILKDTTIQLDHQQFRLRRGEVLEIEVDTHTPRWHYATYDVSFPGGEWTQTGTASAYHDAMGQPEQRYRDMLRHLQYTGVLATIWHGEPGEVARFVKEQHYTVN